MLNNITLYLFFCFEYHRTLSHILTGIPQFYTEQCFGTTDKEELLVYFTQFKHEQVINLDCLESVNVDHDGLNRQTEYNESDNSILIPEQPRQCKVEPVEDIDSNMEMCMQ